MPKQRKFYHEEHEEIQGIKKNSGFLFIFVNDLSFVVKENLTSA